MPRLFTAVEVPETVRSVLAAYQDRLKQSLPGAKFVAAQNIHVTLKFLGETDSELLPQIEARLARHLSDFQSFQYTLSEFGAFPALRRARTFWAGVGEGARELKALFKKTEKALLNLGFGREKRSYNAHLTLARLRRPQDIESLVAGLAPVPDWPPIAVKEVVLFESRLTPSGPIYEAVLRQPLAGSDQAAGSNPAGPGR